MVFILCHIDNICVPQTKPYVPINWASYMNPFFQLSSFKGIVLWRNGITIYSLGVFHDKPRSFQTLIRPFYCMGRYTIYTYLFSVILRFLSYQCYLFYSANVLVSSFVSQSLTTHSFQHSHSTRILFLSSPTLHAV